MTSRMLGTLPTVRSNWPGGSRSAAVHRPTVNIRRGVERCLKRRVERCLEQHERRSLDAGRDLGAGQPAAVSVLNAPLHGDSHRRILRQHVDAGGEAEGVSARNGACARRQRVACLSGGERATSVKRVRWEVDLTGAGSSARSAGADKTRPGV